MSMSKFGIKPFDGKNFGNFLYRIEATLDENDCKEAIEEPMKESDSAKSKKKNATAKSILIQCMSDECLDLIKECETAYDIIKTLKQNYARKSLTEQMQLKRQLANLKFDEKVPLKEFFIRFDALIRDLKDCGIVIEEKERICNLLLAMPKSYDFVTSSLETLENVNGLNMDFVKNRLLSEEVKKCRHVNVDQASTDKPAVFHAHVIRCYLCNQLGHKKIDCPKLEKDRNKQQYYNNPTYNKHKEFRQYDHKPVGKSYHYQYNNEPHQFNKSGKHHHYGQYNFHKKNGKGNTANYSDSVGQWRNVATTSNNINVSSTDTSIENENSDKKVCFSAENNSNVEKITEEGKLMFCIDSGCTDHLVKDVGYFKSYVKLKNTISISIAEEESGMDAIGIGTIEGTLMYNGKPTICELKNVLHVPHARKNLLSVKRLDKAGFSVLFENGETRIYNEKIGTIGVGERTNLYDISFNVKYYNQNTQPECNMSEMKIWHSRLGHIGVTNLKRLVNEDLVSGIKIKNISENLDFCEACVEGKMTRNSFGIRKSASKILEIIHTDLCGPISPTSNEGHKYFLTFIDGYSHFTMVYPIQEKSQVFEKFKEYYNLVSNMFGEKILKLRCDNGGEYVSREFQNFCKNEGIIMDYTVPYTPQQNGTAERMNRTLTEKMRAMISQSGIPKEMWHETLITATYLLNRSPTTSNVLTPAEFWYKSKPDLSNLKIFGCAAFSLVPHELQTSKLNSRCQKCVFIGYAQNGYRLYNIEKNKMILSRDVIFKEDEFPFKENELKDNSDNYEVPEPENIDQCNLDCNLDNSSNKRSRKLPARFDDYEVYLASNGMSFVNNIPVDYVDMMSNIDKEKWLEAMDREIKSIEENKTWDIVQKPVDKKILTSKWVYAYKEHETSENKYKARLVVRGYEQEIDSFDYNNIYSPVAKLETIRSLLSVGIQHDFYFKHLDITTAFLNGDLKEDVYLYPPKGMTLSDNQVFKLKKSLYGLKQSAQCWNKKFDELMTKLGFQRSENDFCMYSKFDNDTVIYLLVYVDDIILASSSQSLIEKVQKCLSDNFKLKDKGELKNFLGLEINHNRNLGILTIKQSKYAEKLVKRFNMEFSKVSQIPIEPKLNFTNIEKSSGKPYRELIGSLMYIMLGSRPDLAFAVNFFSRFQNNYSDEIWSAAKKILSYIKNTLNYGLVYKKSTNCNIPVIESYVDSDWGNDNLDRKSISGYLFKIHGNIVKWVTRKQTSVALSSTEAELIALCTCVTDGLWLNKILSDLNVDVDKIIIHEDNQGCLNILKNPENNRRVKHVDVKYNFVCNKINSGEIVVHYICTNQQIADILTKGLSIANFVKFRNMLGVEDIK
ncbi:hypothetical protein M8J77_025850 [Diaphorina citri]|nr:hypothetical protein M8J77_012606 [Diaphorina citri]KAI5714640.1 hypothetical protein M8J77_002989 [Diaphorina citri]KAI5718398.1 hypothetical protein M8J77_020722 [Diaphorina citri]KAI5721071.1 hypothetical protein M8J77_015662 [Diaphorina citri]KAI5724367.1 hypothetical protein M8J77_001875 [Diaphorina citri]